MIGQLYLQKQLKELAEANALPRFIILVGPKGSGKKRIANLIAEFADLIPLHTGISVNDVRETITNSYKIATPSLQIIPDADGMSVNAKNALLKVTEEPPNNVYFVMTLEDINNTLATIRSRGTVFNMNQYSLQELTDFYTNNFPNDSTELKELVLSVSNTPGDVLLAHSQDIKGLVDYVELVMENVAEVSGANALKITEKVSLKEGSEGYDLDLFWTLFEKQCLYHATVTAQERYIRGITVTSNYLKDLRVKGINKQMLMDNWILDIRKEWIVYGS